MTVPFTYRRPVSSSPSTSDNADKVSIDESVSSGKSGSIRGIPEQLSFDRVMNGGTCPPCSKRDFFNYLKYIEQGAENLLFYVWYLDYEKRFNALPDFEKKLSPEWTEAMAAKETAAYRAQNKTTGYPSKETAEIFKSLDDEKKNATTAEEIAPFAETEQDPSDPTRGVTSTDTASTDRPKSSSPTAGTNVSSKTMYSQKTEAAFQDAGLKWQPFTVQPYREEMSRIITIYLADKAPRQLNLSARDVSTTLHALELTTHPSAFRSVIKNVEWTLRNQSHPNFIRWTICNGNRPRVIFARGLGVFLIFAAIVMGVLLCLSKAGRAWRVMCLLLFTLGISTLIAAWKGMCVVLHGLHHRHLRPWELFDGDDVKRASDADYDDETAANPISWEDEPWVARYQKRNVIRKIFDREVWIEEPVLRQIQDTIFLQSLLGAFVIGAIITGIFCAVPKGNLF
jgi:hypothetical protein